MKPVTATWTAPLPDTTEAPMQAGVVGSCPVMGVG